MGDHYPYDRAASIGAVGTQGLSAHTLLEQMHPSVGCLPGLAKARRFRFRVNPPPAHCGESGIVGHGGRVPELLSAREPAYGVGIRA